MNKENNTVKVLLIRHAESMFNKGQRVACDSEVEVLEGSECLETKFSAKLLDCSITKEGYKQVD